MFFDEVLAKNQCTHQCPRKVEHYREKTLHWIEPRTDDGSAVGMRSSAHVLTICFLPLVIGSRLLSATTGSHLAPAAVFGCDCHP